MWNVGAHWESRRQPFPSYVAWERQTAKLWLSVGMPTVWFCRYCAQDRRMVSTNKWVYSLPQSYVLSCCLSGIGYLRCWPRSWLYVTDVPAVLSKAKTFCLQKPLVQTWWLFQLVWVFKHPEFAFRLHLGFVQRVSWEWNLCAVIQSLLAAQVLFCSGALCPAELIQVNAVLD